MRDTSDRRCGYGEGYDYVSLWAWAWAEEKFGPDYTLWQRDTLLALLNEVPMVKEAA